MDADTKGYRSRRLSISENINPGAYDNAATASSADARPSADTAEGALGSPAKGFSPMRMAFNLLIALLIWVYAISPYYDAVCELLGISVTRDPFNEHNFVSPDPASNNQQSEVLLPAPPKNLLTNTVDEESTVMSEIRTVKSEINRLKNELREKSEIHERDPYKESRDAELSKIHEVIDALTIRLDVMTEESRRAAAVQQVTTTTTARPTEAPPKRFGVNAANAGLGAMIWNEKTTHKSSLKRTFLNAILLSIPASKRYEDLKHRVNRWKGPGILLDEQPIRGYGDAYCVPGGKQGLDDWFSVGIILPYEVMIDRILIEYIPHDLDPNPQLRPKLVKIQTYNYSESPEPAKQSLHSLTFNQEGQCELPVNFSTRADRLAFKFHIDSELGACIYRIRVFGGIKRSEIG